MAIDPPAPPRRLPLGRCTTAAIWLAGLALAASLVRVLLDGRLASPLPSTLEEIFVIRPAGSAAAAAAAAAFTPANDTLVPPLRLPPVMGFNTWNAFGCDISEDLILAIASSLVERRLLHAGYSYVGIDDCWQAEERGPDGALHANPTRFPRGIRFLADELHAMGLQLGIYSDYGVRTCAGYPGSYGHYEQDAATFAAWGVDLVKFDRCAPTIDQDRHPARYYRQMAAAIRAAGRPMVYSLCNWGRADAEEGPPWRWAPRFAQMWRTTTDIFPWYGRVVAILEENAPLAPFAGPGAFNDPDMLEVGVNGTLLNLPGFVRSSLSESESSLHFSMWAMLSAPLLIGADLRHAPPWVFAILSNPEVIALSQDPLAAQAVRLVDDERGFFVRLPLVPFDFWGRVRTCFGACRKIQVWLKPLANNSAAIALVNLGDQLSADRSSFGPEDIEISGAAIELASTVDFASRSHCVRDPLRHQDGEVIPEGTSASSLILKRTRVQPRSHELLVIRPCTCHETSDVVDAS